MLRVGARLLGRAGAAILKPAGRLQCSALQPRAKLLKACRAVPGHRLQAAPPQLSRLSGARLVSRGFADSPGPRRVIVRAGQPVDLSTSPENLIVLGIETSCDDTGAAVVTGDGRILGEALASQGALHEPWGGVVPDLARRAHEEAIGGVVAKALANAGVQPSQLSAVAVTVGPGLSLCLRVGVLEARRICAENGVPMVPVHHMEAHSLLARLTSPKGTETHPEFPYATLLVSGGHNLLALVSGIGSYEILGSTMDDAIGEAYDKTARLLGLDEALALEGDPTRFPLTVPLRTSRTHRLSCEFSYAGLKTSARVAIERAVGGEKTVPLAQCSPEERQLRADLAAGFQEAAAAHLSERTGRGLRWAREAEPRARCLVVAGGVAANKVVRARLAAVAEKEGFQLVAPPPRLCTDNGVMVAWAGVERLAMGISQPPPALSEVGLGKAEFVELKPRWPLGPRHPRAEEAVQLDKVRSLKKLRIHAPLTAVAGDQQQPASAAVAG